MSLLLGYYWPLGMSIVGAGSWLEDAFGSSGFGALCWTGGMMMGG